MIARCVLLLTPFALVAVLVLRGSRLVTLGRLSACLLSAGVMSASDWPAVTQSTRRLQSVRAKGAVFGLIACAVPLLLLRHRLQINSSAMLAGAVLGIVIAQWWINRVPRTERRSAPLTRRRLMDLVGFAPVALLGAATALAVLADIEWFAMRPVVSSSRFPEIGQVCALPQIASAHHHLLEWAVVGPVLLISLGGALVILRRAVDPRVPAAADAALRAAAIRTALGCGIIFTGGYALSTYVNALSFVGNGRCLTPDTWWFRASGPLFLLLILVLSWCSAAYVIAPARRLTAQPISPAPEVLAVS